MFDLILLEDEPVLRQELAEFLGDSGFAVNAVATVAEFDACFDTRRHCIVILDLGLPDGDGSTLIRRLRAANADLGIVVLTARDTTGEKVTGLADGADYYLGKSVDLDELAAIVGALSRRLKMSRGAGLSAVSAGRWLLQLGPRLLRAPGFAPIELSHQDCVVLQALMGNAGEIVSRRQIVAALGERFLDYDQRRLDTQMRRLRRKVEQATGTELPVKTSRNAGYCFFAAAAVQ